MCDAWQVLAGEKAVAGRVVVVGGDVVGCETTEHLVRQGCKVSLVDMRGAIAGVLSVAVLPTMLESVATFGVRQ